MDLVIERIFRQMPHREFHRSEHIGWLRASVLGANDGLISTSSLVVGVAAALTSQADTEQADLAREKGELATTPELERAELASIYIGRGLTPELAGEVADQLMAHDAIGAHARDELGMSEMTRARPIQAALASAAAFAIGASLPLVLVILLPLGILSITVAASSLLLLMVLGATAARLGGAPVVTGAVRVAFWGAVAMATTALVGR